LECVNLYIGGCSLETHAANLLSGAPSYALEINGEFTKQMVSLPDALNHTCYDIVTLQQASHFSGMPETYYPYLTALADAVRAAQPAARLMIHETWAYEIDSTHGAFGNYHRSQREMYERLRAAYTEAAEKIGAGILPVGDTVQYLRENKPEFDYAHGGISLNRDGFHLSIPVGRYLAACVWLETLCAADARNISFVPDGTTEKDAELLRRVRDYVHEYVILSK
ncbi:MAG: DUF4886 domain-containing protein, partial [Eubacteriales bacterium]